MEYWASVQMVKGITFVWTLPNGTGVSAKIEAKSTIVWSVLEKLRPDSQRPLQ